MWDHFLGSLNDQTIIFWFAWWRENYNQFSGNYFDYSYMYGSPIGGVVNYFSNQWLIWGIYFLLAKLTAPIFAFNLLTAVSIALILYISYSYFRTYFSVYISILNSFLYLFSTYSMYKVTNHLDLFQIWVIPLFLIIHNKYMHKQSSTYLYLSSGTLALITFISNYYAFFLLIYVATVSVFELWKRQTVVAKVQQFKGLIIFLIIYLLLVSPVMFPFFKLSATDATSVTGSKVNRPIDDYVTFSARPWNYILPSSENPIFGSYVTYFNKWLERKDYFLFNNYFPKEHGAIYLGIGNVVLLAYGIYLLIRSKIREPQLIRKLLFICFVLFLFSMPPFFTLSGVKIYIPSYLLYKFIPVFRVLSRLFVIIYLLVLTINGNTLTFIQSRMSKVMFTLFALIFLSIHLVTSFVRFNVTDVSVSPEIYTYIKHNTNPESTIAVFPYSKTNEFLFWMKEHQRPFFNPREYCNQEYCSENITRELASYEGLQTLKHYGVSYILVDEKANLDKFEPLISNGDLSIINEIQESYLIRVN